MRTSLQDQTHAAGPTGPTCCGRSGPQLMYRPEVRRMKCSGRCDSAGVVVAEEAQDHLGDACRVFHMQVVVAGKHGQPSITQVL